MLAVQLRQTSETTICKRQGYGAYALTEDKRRDAVDAKKVVKENRMTTHITLIQTRIIACKYWCMK
jgi:hypothetical protein